MGGVSLIAFPRGEGEEGGVVTKVGVRSGVETILTADCRDLEGHWDESPLRKWWSMILMTMTGTTMAGIILTLITALFIMCTAMLAMKSVGIQFSSWTDPPPRIGTHTELGGGSPPNIVWQGH